MELLTNFKNKKIRHYITKLLFLISGLLIFFMFMYFSWDKIHQLGQIKLLPLLFIFMFTFGITSCVSVRWGSLVNTIGKRQVAKWHEYYYYFVVSRLLGFILPKDVTDLFGRAGFINRLHSMSFSRSGFSVLFDRFFDIVTLLIFFCSSLIYWLGFVSMTKGILIMVILSSTLYVAIIIFYRKFFHFILWITTNGMKVFKNIPVLKKISFNYDIFEFLDRKTVFFLLSLSVLKFCLTAGRFVLIASALQISVPSYLIVLGTPLAQLAYVVAVTPGGLGIFEAGWFGVLCTGGIDVGEASLFVVGQRIIITISIVFFFTISQLHSFSYSKNKSYLKG